MAPLLRQGEPIGPDIGPRGRSARSPTSRSRCWSRSPTRPLSRSRTRGSSRAAGEQRRPARGAGAADGDGEVLQAISRLADRPAGRPRRARRERRAAVRRDDARSIQRRGRRPCVAVAHHGRVGPPDAGGLIAASAALASDAGSVERRTIHVPDVEPRSGASLPDRLSTLRIVDRLRVLGARCCARARRSASSIVRRRGPALHRPADRAAGDLRRPGRDRDRERPPVPGAAGRTAELSRSVELQALCSRSARRSARRSTCSRC